MSKHTFEFKKNSIADWIGRDLSVALRGRVKSNSSPKAFIAASAFVTFLAVSPISHAKIENNGQPIFINGKRKIKERSSLGRLQLGCL